MSIGVVDCDCCLGENDFAAEISKWPQADEGMRERGHDVSRHRGSRE